MKLEAIRERNRIALSRYASLDYDEWIGLVRDLANDVTTLLEIVDGQEEGSALDREWFEETSSYFGE